MTARTLREHWREYDERVMPLTAGPEQRTETRRAFYAGSWAVLSAMLNNVGDDPDEPPTEDEERLISGLVAECEQFAADIAEGNA